MKHQNYNCSICSQKTFLWSSKNGYNIFECNTCGHGQVLPIVSEEKIRELYSTSGHDSEDIKIVDINLQTVLDREKTYPNSTLDAQRIVSNSLKLNKLSTKNILDVGAGYGFFSNAYLSEYFKVDAIENARLELKIFEEMNGFKPFQGLFEEFNTSKKYSHILMSQILEHVREPDLWVKKAFNLLEKDGLLIIALPNFGSIFKKVLQSKEPYIIPPYHLNYFTYRSLRNLLQQHHFQIVKLDTVSRIPFEKVLTKFHVPKFLHKFIILPGLLCLKVMDSLRLGAMLNIYARKIKI